MRTRTSTKRCPTCGAIPIIVGGGRGRRGLMRYYKCECGARWKDNAAGGLSPVFWRNRPAPRPAKVQPSQTAPLLCLDCSGILIFSKPGYYRCLCGSKFRFYKGELCPLKQESKPRQPRAERKRPGGPGREETIVFMSADEFEQQYEPPKRQVQPKRAPRNNRQK